MQNINETSYFNDYMKVYLQRESKFIKESSYSIYSAYVHNKIIPFFTNKKINELTSELIQEFAIYLQTNANVKSKGGLAHSTVKSIIIFIKSSLDYLFKQNIIKSFDTNVKVSKTGTNNSLKTFTDIEIIAIRDYLKQSNDIRNIGILIAIYSGLRIGEVCGLKYSDIDIITGTITVKRTVQRIHISSTNGKESKLIITTPKSSKSTRSIPINNEIIAILTKFPTSENFILTQTTIPLEPRALRYYFSSILKNNNIPKRPFHSLRHTFATRLIKNTNDFKTVSELLGHSSISVTLDTYTHTTFDTKISCINKF